MVIGVANVGGPNPRQLGAIAARSAGGRARHRQRHAHAACDHAGARGGGGTYHRRLIDVRTPPRDIPIASGRKRSGKRLLAVGTDCALGKKYTALAIARAFEQRGVDADFRATGQTGIMIAGAACRWMPW